MQIKVQRWDQPRRLPFVLFSSLHLTKDQNYAQTAVFDQIQMLGNSLIHTRPDKERSSDLGCFEVRFLLLKIFLLILEVQAAVDKLVHQFRKCCFDRLVAELLEQAPRSLIL